MTQLPKLYRISEVMSQLGISRATVYRMVAAGKLRLVKVGQAGSRISAESVEAFTGIGHVRSETRSGAAPVPDSGRRGTSTSKPGTPPMRNQPAPRAPTEVNTVFLLLAQYGATSIVPLDVVCRDYFSHLTPEKLLHKVGIGEIALPVIRIESSQKAAKGVHVVDLAAYIDARRAEAQEEYEQLRGKR
ncbi:pyocin activator PrtN family protein [Paraburkholderia lycopersici]